MSLRINIRLTLTIFTVVFLTQCVNDKNNKQSIETFQLELIPAIEFSNKQLESWNIEQRMLRYNIPGVSLVIIDDGKVVWSKGFGLSSFNGSQTVSENTLFQAASIAKLATAVAVLNLSEEKKIDLDENVNSYLKGWKLSDNKFHKNNPVTLRQLLSHTSGVNNGGFSGYTATEETPSLLQILNGLSPSKSAAIEVNQAPGELVKYSGGGYLIIQKLIEDISGKTFEDYVHTSVFVPLGMDSSNFEQPLLNIQKASVACGHGHNNDQINSCNHVYPELAAAGLWSTAKDLAKLVIHLSDSLNGLNSAVLEQDTVKIMLTPRIGNMGLGPGIHGVGENLHFDHAGWNKGYRSYVVMYPFLKKGVVVMANADGSKPLIDEIVRGVSRKFLWPDFKPKSYTLNSLNASSLKDFSGDFKVDKYGFTIKIEAQDEYLLLSTPRGSWYSFYPISESKFMSLEDSSELEFIRDENSQIKTIQLWGMTASLMTI